MTPQPEPERSHLVGHIVAAVLVFAAVGAVVFAIFHQVEQREMRERIYGGDPSTVHECTVSALGEVEFEAGGRYSSDDYAVKVETQECGTLRLERIPPARNGDHMEIYRQLEVGKAYSFSTDEDGRIYRVQGPLAR